MLSGYHIHLINFEKIEKNKKWSEINGNDWVSGCSLLDKDSQTFPIKCYLEFLQSSMPLQVER